MSSDADTDDLWASVLRVTKYNSGGPQPETVRDTLATLVTEGHLERVDGGRESQYQLGGEQ